MSAGNRVLAAICSQRHQFPLIFKVLVAMGVLLGMSVFLVGAAALEHPMVIVDAVIIGAGLLFFGVAIRLCQD